MFTEMDNGSDTTTDRWLTSVSFNISTSWSSNATNHSNDSFSNSTNGADKEPRQAFVPCNNPENLIDEKTAKEVEQLLHLTVLFLLELFGVTTNVISCIVFVRQGLKDRINLCLFCLALADISFLLLIFAAKFFSFLVFFDENLAEYWSQKYFSTVLGPMMGAMNISNLMTMIISVERCICVVSPFTAKKFLKTKYMAIGISIMAGYIFGMYSLLDLKYVTVQITDPVTKETQWTSRLSSFYTDNKVTIDILYNYLLSLAIPSLSLAVVVIATSITVSRLRTTLAWRAESTNKRTTGERGQNAVTKMLTVICLIYVTTIIPSLTQVFVRTLLPGYIPTGKYCNTFVVVQTMVHVCEVTNSSVNFIVYYSMGSKFRATVKEMFGTRRGKPPWTASLPTISDAV